MLKIFLLPAILITIFLTFAARPLAVLITLAPFKIKWNQFIFISSAGLRGAASIVFAILVVSENTNLANDLFHIVFVVALLSVSLQGSLLPFIAKKVDMIDKYSDVRKTFNDFQQESAIALNKVIVSSSHPWLGQCIKDIHFNGKALILMIIRDGKKIVPRGLTEILENDEILIGSTYTETDIDINLCETSIDDNHEWLNLEIKDICLSENNLIALIKRGEEYFVPNGNTKIILNDTIVFYDA